MLIPIIPIRCTLVSIVDTRPAYRANKRWSQSGFTLTELMVVIVVIVVCAAIIFPLFATMPQHNRHASCASNLKQLALGTLMYAEDNDDRIYPYEYNGPSGPGDRVTWEYYTDYRADHPNDYRRGMLFPYVQNLHVYLCPAATSFAGTAGGNSGSYGVNSTLFGTHINGLNSSGVALSAAEDHAQTILLADTASVVQGELHGNDVLDPPSHRNVVHGRHAGMALVVWLDGHVKLMKPVCGKTTTEAYFDKFSLGTLLHGTYTGNPKKDNYYWELVKPQ